MSSSTGYCDFTAPQAVCLSAFGNCNTQMPVSDCDSNKQSKQCMNYQGAFKQCLKDYSSLTCIDDSDCPTTMASSAACNVLGASGTVDPNPTCLKGKCVLNLPTVSPPC